MTKVLVVTDRRSMLRIINNYLKDDYEVIGCSTTDTLDFTDVKCLVLSTDSNWYEIARSSVKAGISFIAVTSGQDLESMLMTKILGGYNRVVPPFKKDDLLEKVKGCVLYNSDKHI